MSVRVMTWVWDNSRAKGNERLLLLAIADFAHDDGDGAYPSVARLMAKTRLTRPTVIALTRRLEELGELEVLRSGGRRPHVYRVLMGRERGTPLADAPDALTNRKEPQQSENFRVAPTLKSTTPTLKNPTPTLKSTEPNPKARLYPKPLGTVIENRQEPLENTRAKTKRTKTQIDPDWEPSPRDVAFAEKTWADAPGLDMALEVEQFKSHHAAKLTESADWSASWRTWVCNARKWHKPTGGARPRNAPMPRDDAGLEPADEWGAHNTVVTAWTRVGEG